MKKTIILSLALVLGLATAVAQNDRTNNRGNRPERPRLTTEQRAQLITDRVAKSYDLTAEQKAKLLELNLTTLVKTAQPQGAPKDNADAKPQGAGTPQRRDMNERDGQGFAYMKALREIMTQEQFQAYMLDKSIERSLLPQMQRRQGQPGPRGGFAPKDRQKGNADPAKSKKKDKKAEQ